MQRYSQLKQAQTLLPAGVQEMHSAALLQRHHVEELEGPAMLQALTQVRSSDTVGCQGSAMHQAQFFWGCLLTDTQQVLHVCSRGALLSLPRLGWAELLT